MSRDEFIIAYACRSGKSVSEVLQGQVALRCACGAEECEGWAMVSDDQRSIEAHNDLYAPKDPS